MLASYDQILVTSFIYAVSNNCNSGDKNSKEVATWKCH